MDGSGSTTCGYNGAWGSSPPKCQSKSQTIVVRLAHVTYLRVVFSVTHCLQIQPGDVFWIKGAFNFKEMVNLISKG